ncbi:MAG TPA: ATP-binding protein [Lysobacter sp.]
MSWIDLTWPMLAAASLVLGLVHAMVWLAQPRHRIHLALALAAGSIGILALLELSAFHATQPDELAVLIRWMHVPVAVIVLSLLFVVHRWFGYGSIRLAAGVVALRMLGLLLNFTSGDNLNFRHVEAVGLSSWWGAAIAHPIGENNPLILFNQASNVLLLLYLAQTLMRSVKHPEPMRRAALVVCGGALLLTLVMMGSAALIALGLPRAPLSATPSFVIVVLAMSYRLGTDLFRSQRLSMLLQESELRGLRAEKHLELAAATSGLGLWYWDVARNLFRENTNNRGLLGNNAESASAEDALFRHAEPEGVVRRDFEDVIRDEAYALEYRIRRPDGERRWISLHGSVEHGPDGRPSLVRGVTQDVTRHKREENLLRSLLEAAPSALLLIDDGGRVRYANAEAARVFAWTQEEMHGVPVDALMPQAIGDGHARRPGAPAVDLTGRCRDGREFPLELGVRRLQLDDRPHLVAAVTDLTARRRMEEEVAMEREGLAHLSRVTMLGELSGSLAHELNQPLAAILSNAQAAQRILRRDPSDIHEVQEILADIVENDRRAGHVISRLRGLLKKEAREHVYLALNEVVLDCMRLMRNDLVNRRVDCRVDLAPGLPACHGDRIQLQQVLLNLIINACDALPMDGSERTIAVRTARSELGVRVEVADTGHGIAAERLERIFAPFESSKPDGMGMGLAVCRTIIHAHGGRIWAENAEPRGARVSFDLPQA